MFIRIISKHRRLARESRVVFRSSPYSSGAKPVKFNFDWSFDYYPLAYERPGPVMTLALMRLATSTAL